jgi:hypothetical protein
MADPVDAFNRGAAGARNPADFSFEQALLESAQRGNASNANGGSTAHASVNLTSLYVTAIVGGAICGVFSVFIGALVPSTTRWI